MALGWGLWEAPARFCKHSSLKMRLFGNRFSSQRLIRLEFRKSKNFSKGVAGVFTGILLAPKDGSIQASAEKAQALVVQGLSSQRLISISNV